MGEKIVDQDRHSSDGRNVTLQNLADGALGCMQWGMGMCCCISVDACNVPIVWRFGCSQERGGKRHPMAPITANLSCEYLLGQYFDCHLGKVGRSGDDSQCKGAPLRLTSYEVGKKLWRIQRQMVPLLNFYLLG